MLYLFSHERCPYTNQALEYYLLDNCTKYYFLLYINDISVLVGRNQIIEREINKDFILKNKIPILRRVSGGGTVTHDQGNINFSFIGNREEFINSSVWIKELFKKHFNISLKLKVNSLYVNNLKISGSAQYFKKERYICHSTLLVESNINMINESIKNDMYDLYITRAQRSIKVPITNLRSFHKDISRKRILSIVNNVYRFENVIKYVDLKSELFLNYIKNFKSSKWINKEPSYSLHKNEEIEFSNV